MSTAGPDDSVRKDRDESDLCSFLLSRPRITTAYFPDILRTLLGYFFFSFLFVSSSVGWLDLTRAGAENRRVLWLLSTRSASTDSSFYESLRILAVWDTWRHRWCQAWGRGAVTSRRVRIVVLIRPSGGRVASISSGSSRDGMRGGRPLLAIWLGERVREGLPVKQPTTLPDAWLGDGLVYFNLTRCWEYPWLASL